MKAKEIILPGKYILKYAGYNQPGLPTSEHVVITEFEGNLYVRFENEAYLNLKDCSTLDEFIPEFDYD